MEHLKEDELFSGSSMLSSIEMLPLGKAFKNTSGFCHAMETLWNQIERSKHVFVAKYAQKR